MKALDLVVHISSIVQRWGNKEVKIWNPKSGVWEDVETVGVNADGESILIYTLSEEDKQLRAKLRGE